MLPMSALPPETTPTRRFRRGRWVVLLTVLSVGAGLALAPVGNADTRGDKARLDRQISALRSQLGETTKDLADAYIALRRTQAELPVAQRELTAAQAKVVAAEKHNPQVAEQLAIAKANEAKAADVLATNAKDTKQTSDLIGDLARRSYQQGGMGELAVRSEEHTSELQSRSDLVCRLLLEKKKKNTYRTSSETKTNKNHT